MNHRLHSAVLAAGFAAAFAALPVRAAVLSTTSFAAPQAVSSYELSADSVSNFVSAPGLSFAPGLPTFQSGTAPSFAGSSLLSPNLALDAGRNLDIAARFDNYGDAASPILSAVTAPYLGLANGGRYAGFTYTPSADLRLRLGASLNSDCRWNSLSADPFSGERRSAAGLSVRYCSTLVAPGRIVVGLLRFLTPGVGVTAITSSRRRRAAGLRGRASRQGKHRRDRGFGASGFGRRLGDQAGLQRRPVATRSAQRPDHRRGPVLLPRHRQARIVRRR